MILLAGLLTEKTELIKLSETQCWIVWLGMVSVWPTLLTEVANAWWGTKDLLPIVGLRLPFGARMIELISAGKAAEKAGATGALPWQEFVLTAAHIPSGVGTVAAWAVLSWGLRNRDGQAKGKKE
jgi:(hydroxyamino)benzene mutase